MPPCRRTVVPCRIVPFPACRIQAGISASLLENPVVRHRVPWGRPSLHSDRPHRRSDRPHRGRRPAGRRRSQENLPRRSGRPYNDGLLRRWHGSRGSFQIRPPERDRARRSGRAWETTSRGRGRGAAVADPKDPRGSGGEVRICALRRAARKGEFPAIRAETDRVQLNAVDACTRRPGKDILRQNSKVI